MKVKRAGAELPSRVRRARRLRALAPAALALAVALAIAFSATVFTSTDSQADGPPDLGAAFTLPFKLEQGRPAPAPASPGAQPRATIPAPTPTPSALESNQAPAAPTGVNAYPIGFVAIEIEWDQPEGDVDGFELQVSQDGGASWQPLASKSLLTDPAGRLYTWFQHYGLQEGNQTRHYRVRAGNGENWSDWSEPVSATTLTTTPPVLSVAALGKTSVKISWELPFTYAPIREWELQVTADAPPQETISITLPIGSPGGYLVRPPRTPDTRNWAALPTPALEDRTYTHSGLEPGDTRYYRIRLNTTSGAATWSKEAKVITHRGAIPPAPRLTARANGATEIVLNWNGGGSPSFPVTTFEFQDSPDGKRWHDFDLTNGADTRQEIYIEEPGTTRYYRVRAESKGIFGPWSQAASATTENGGAGEPTGLAATEVGPTWVELAWNVPEQVGDSPITGYQVQRASASDINNFTNLGSTTAANLTFRDTGLQPVTDYYYRVAARDAGGLGPWGRHYADVRTNVPHPSAPTLTAQAMERDDGPDLPPRHRYAVWIELTWTEPPRIFSEDWRYVLHLLERSPNGRDDWEHLPTANDATSEKDLDVEPGETWYYRVRASTHDFTGSWSKVASATVRAVAPSDMPYLRSETRAESHIELSWEPPEFDGGSAINGYEIQVSTEGHDEDSNYSTVTRPSASARTYTHRSLQPETEYCYRVRARNSVGWGDWTWGTRQCFHTEPPAPLAPSIAVSTSESTGVEVSWTPRDKQGLTITNFYVQISRDGKVWSNGGSSDADGRGLTFSHAEIRSLLQSGLELTKAYFRVRAEASNGTDSDWSDVVSIALPAE